MTESTPQVFTSLPPDDPLGGSALDSVLNWAESLIFIQQQSTRAQRRVSDELPLLREQVRKCLDKQHNAGGFAPNRLLQIQRLHQLWLELGQAQLASALISQWADPITQAITDPTERNQVRIELLLADSQSRWHFDRTTGLAHLHQAATLIRSLPLNTEQVDSVVNLQPANRWHPSAERYWDDWQQCVEHLYHDWPLAQQGLDWKQAQKQERMTLPNYDPAWDQAKTCLEKAHIARRELLRLEAQTQAANTEQHALLERNIADNVQKAIAYMGQMRYEEDSHFLWNWNAGFSWRWMDLADELLANNLQPAAIPAAMHALNRYWAQMEVHVEKKLAVFIPDAALLKTARQSVHTFRAIHQQQKLYLAAAQMQASHPHDAALFEHAQKGYYNINGGIDSPHDRFGIHLMALLEATGQWERLANMALHAVLDYRKGAAQTAYLLAKRALQEPVHQHAASVQLAWHIIMLQACRCPTMRILIAKDGHEPPQYEATYYLDAAGALSTDNLLIDRVQGVYLAQQKQWAEALPLLERVFNQRPDWASSDVLLALWASRFAVVGVEAALEQNSWNHAAAACWSLQVAHHLQYPDYSHWPQPYASDTTWPLAQLQPLVQHYLTLAQRGFDEFWQAWWVNYIEEKNTAPENNNSLKQALHFCNSTHLIDYSDLCLELASRYVEQGKYVQARSMYQKGIATLYAEHFQTHARGLHECAVALGETEHAEMIQKALDKMS